jgi:dTDP-4-amino-4,6-dideoxygalactose transaminase
MTDAPAPLAFIDLQAQRRRIGPRMDAAIARVLEHGQFILGPEVQALEAELAAFTGARHAITCANGTDALALGLMAKAVRPGDAVLLPSFTFVATAEVVAWLGATPVFCDVDAATFNLAPDGLEAGRRTAAALNLRPVGVITVDLFGQAADYDRIGAFTAAHGLWLMDDAAQGFGATWQGRRLGTFGDLTATSFFPAKPLGCYGDGGAIFTDQDELAEVLRSLRVHGGGQDKYDNVRIGMNGRLDTLQAAVLLEKLRVFEAELAARQVVAQRYAAALEDVVRVPRVAPGASSVFAQYTIVLDDPGRRASLQAALRQDGIPTAIYYPIPLHRQTGYRHYPVAGNGLPVAEYLAARVLSLPFHPDLAPADQDRIVRALRRNLA